MIVIGIAVGWRHGVAVFVLGRFGAIGIVAVGRRHRVAVFVFGRLRTIGAVAVLFLPEEVFGFIDFIFGLVVFFLGFFDFVERCRVNGLKVARAHAEYERAD